MSNDNDGLKDMAGIGFGSLNITTKRVHQGESVITLLNSVESAVALALHYIEEGHPDIARDVLKGLYSALEYYEIKPSKGGCDKCGDSQVNNKTL